MFASSPNPYVEILTPKMMLLGGGAFGRSLYGMRALRKVALKRPLGCSYPWGHREKVMAICEPGSRLSPDSESAGTLPLDSPTSSTVRNACLLFINHPVYNVCHSGLNRLRQSHMVGKCWWSAWAEGLDPSAEKNWALSPAMWAWRRPWALDVNAAWQSHAQPSGPQKLWDDQCVFF